MTINNNNIEQYIFLYKEGLLNDAEKADVQKALDENTAWQQMADMYDPSLQVPAYPKLTYANKHKLRAIATSTTKRRSIIPIWSRVAAACTIIIAVTLFIRLNHSTTSKNTIVASNNTNVFIDSISTSNNTPIKIKTLHHLDSCSKSILSTHNPSEKLIVETTPTNTTEEPSIYFTEDLITFIDENDTSYNNLLEIYTEHQTTTSANQIEFTEQLITYDDALPFSEDEPDNTQMPVWRITLDDWFSNLQLARLEFQTDVVSSITKRIKATSKDSDFYTADRKNL